MELFAYNPYRIIGIPVDSTWEKIDEVYSDLMTMCDNGTIAAYRSPYDFPSLPSFERNSDSLQTAYSKLSGDVYRCFAFSESLYAVNLSQADISIQISNIDSYDKFLSCYMWLIINDKRLTYKNLWFKVAKHIDMLICSLPDRWEELFDHRFPAEVYKDDINSLKGFYNTFCEVILLPLKELVRGSLDCMTASEVLSTALFDGDVTAFMSELEASEKKVKRTGKKAPEMPAVSGASPQLTFSEEKKEDIEPVNLLEGIDEENIYTDALHRMIQSNRARNQEIRSVDTSKVFGNGNLGKEEDVELTMDKVNSKVYDDSKLLSPYDTSAGSESAAQTNVDISDMLNPRINYSAKGIAQMRDNFSGGNTDDSAVQSEKVRRRNAFILKLTVFIIIVVTAVICGYTFREEIVDFIKSFF